MCARDTDRSVFLVVQSRIPHLAFAVSRASAVKQPALWRLLAQLAEQEPELPKRCQDFSAGRGYDSQEEAVGGILGPPAD